MPWFSNKAYQKFINLHSFTVTDHCEYMVELRIRYYDILIEYAPMYILQCVIYPE